MIINRAKARAAETLAFDFFCFLGFFVSLKKRMFRMGGQWPAGGWPKEFKKDVAFLCKIMYNIFRAEK